MISLLRRTTRTGDDGRPGGEGRVGDTGMRGALTFYNTLYDAIRLEATFRTMNRTEPIDSMKVRVRARTII